MEEIGIRVFFPWYYKSHGLYEFLAGISNSRYTFGKNSDSFVRLRFSPIYDVYVGGVYQLKGKNISKEDILALPEYSVSEIIRNKIAVYKFLMKRKEFISTSKRSSSIVWKKDYFVREIVYQIETKTILIYLKDNDNSNVTEIVDVSGITPVEHSNQFPKILLRNVESDSTDLSNLKEVVIVTYIDLYWLILIYKPWPKII